MPRLVVAPDKFRGSATAAEAAGAIGSAAAALGWAVDQVPVSDGGEGFCAALGGRARRVTVRDPLGRPVEAAWSELDGGGTAVIEMAMASGLDLVGGPDANDPVAASTAGTGELMAAAVKAGARRLLVGMGGSATTDGGWGALQVLEPHSRLSGVHISVACDVRTRFTDAATVFSPQKGASPSQVQLLTRRLEALGVLYRDRFGVDVQVLDGSGAAGGLAGGLAAIGGDLVEGFDLVADRLDLAGAIEGADLVITGEGLLDEQSYEGKSVGGVLALARDLGVPVVVIAGDAEGRHVCSYRTLVEEVGEERAHADPLAALHVVTARVLGDL